MSAYYNEIDPHAAQWLRNLIRAGAIADGVVDERDVRDVKPSEIDGFTQCHFFAGIGVWSYALRLAGISDNERVWTASCPCQPFSAAGSGLGIDDERHLWPAIDWLAEQLRPQAILGEQVSSPDGLAWLDLVSADLEAKNYAIGALDTCAASVGAPHIRQRLYFAAHDRLAKPENFGRAERSGSNERPARSGITGNHDRGPENRMDHTEHARLERYQRTTRSTGRQDADGSGFEGMLPRRMADTDDNGRDQRWQGEWPRGNDGTDRNSLHDRPRATNGFWQDADWLYCRDGSWRSVRSGTFPLAHGASGRVGRLRAYGNSLCAEQAAAFITAYRTRHMVDLNTTPAGDLFEWAL